MVKFKELHVWVNRVIYLVVEGRDCNRVTSELNNKTLNNHKSECLSDLHPHPFFPFHCLMNCIPSVSLNHLTLNVSKCLAFLISPLSFPSLIINLLSYLLSELDPLFSALRVLFSPSSPFSTRLVCNASFCFDSKQLTSICYKVTVSVEPICLIYTW